MQCHRFNKTVINGPLACTNTKGRNGVITTWNILLFTNM